MKVTVTIGEHERSVEVPDTLLEGNADEQIDQAEIDILRAFSEAYKACLGGEPVESIDVPDTNWETTEDEVVEEAIPLRPCVCGHNPERHVDEGPGELGRCQMDYAIDEKAPDGPRGTCDCLRYEESVI